MRTDLHEYPCSLGRLQMNKDKYVFVQLTEHLDYFKFRQLVGKCLGDSYVKHFSCWNQLLTLMLVIGQNGRENDG